MWDVGPAWGTVSRGLSGERHHVRGSSVGTAGAAFKDHPFIFLTGVDPLHLHCSLNSTCPGALGLLARGEVSVEFPNALSFPGRDTDTQLLGTVTHSQS